MNAIEKIKGLSAEYLRSVCVPYNGERFTAIVFVPTQEEHYSGWQCMKYVLFDGKGDIVGTVDNGSDVLHINGIGGYGEYGNGFEEALRSGLIPHVDWCIDCLPAGFIRLFSSKQCKVDAVCGSDFEIFVITEDKENAE